MLKKTRYAIGTAVLLMAVSSGLWADSGDVLRRLPAPGRCSTGLTSDGRCLWVADRKSDSLYRIDPIQGKVLRRIASPGYFPTGLAWDGKSLWVSDLDFENTSTGVHTGKIYRVDPETGTVLQMLEAPSNDPQALVWDGRNLWMADNTTDRLSCISIEDGTTIREFRSPSADPQGLAWDGSYLWVSDRSRDELCRVNPSSGDVVMIVPSPGPYPRGLAWLENTLWTADYETDTIDKLAIDDGVPFVRKNERYAEIEYTHEILNLGPGTVENLQVALAQPMSRPSQEILDIRYSGKPDQIVRDVWNQSLALFRIGKLPSGKRFSPVMKVKARIYSVMHAVFPEKVGRLEDIPEGVRETYLRDGSKYDIDDPVIRSAVEDMVGGEKNPYWIARKIFNGLMERMHYELSGGWNIAPTVLKRGSGSCSEYSFVFIALCRAAGLPARYVGSVVVRGDNASLDEVFHRWVEVYLPSYGWIPVDPSGGDQVWPRDQAMAFGHLDNRFLITTEGGGGSEYLGWDYNSADTWNADGPVKLRVEKIGEWEPLK